MCVSRWATLALKKVSGHLFLKIFYRFYTALKRSREKYNSQITRQRSNIRYYNKLN